MQTLIEYNQLILAGFMLALFATVAVLIWRDWKGK